MNNEDNITALPGNHLPAVQHQGAIRPYGHPLEEAERDDDDDEIDLRELWQVLIRRKGLIIAIAALVFVTSLVVTLMMQPIYRASTTIQIKEEAQVLEYDVESKGGNVNRRDFYQTQYELLKSRMLAKRTIEDLGIESIFRQQKLASTESSWLGELQQQFTALFSGSRDNNADGNNDTVEDIQQDAFAADATDEKKLLGERPIEDQLLERLAIAPVKNSQIVTVHYDDTNPERAATIVNTLASNYIEVNLERRIDAASYAENRVQEEIIKTRSRLLEAEEKLNDYAKEKGIVLTEDNQSLVNRKLSELSASLTKAEAERVKAEIAYTETRDSDSADKVLGNSTVQALKKQLAELESKYQAAVTTSSSFDNSNLRTLRQRLAQLQSQYQAEITASRSGDNPVIRSMTQELARLQRDYQGELSSPRAIENPVIRTLKGRLAQLQSEYQAEISASESFKNPTIQTLKQRVAQLQALLQGGQSSNSGYDGNSIQRTLKNQLSQLESQYQEKAQVYKPAYPLMVQLRQKINEVKQQIVQENASVRNSLTQQINQLKQDIAQETRAVTQNTRANLLEQINQIKTDIARETSSITNSNRTYLKKKIDQLRIDIARETRTLQTGTQSYLKQQIDQLRVEIARETRASDANNKITLEQRIAELKNQIILETATISATVQDGLKGRMIAAIEQEDAIRQQLEEQKIKSVTLREQNVGLNEIKRELDSIRNIYTGLLDRQKQIGIAGGIGNNNIAVVDEAIIPFSKHKPNTQLNLMLGAVLGLFLGTVVAFLLEFLDDRIKNTDELSRISSGLPLLGIIPRAKEKAENLALMAQTDPRSAFAEAYRSLRTNLKFSTRDGAPAVVGITSSSPSEGKSTSAINIAATFANDGNTVLLVDTDLRKPSVHKRLRLDNSKGLANYLTGQDSIKSVTQSCQIPNVYVVTAGPTTPNPVELLSSDRLDALYDMARIDKTFDVIVLDMPPVIGLADALVISSRSDATMIAVSMGDTKKQVLLGSLKRLYQSRTNIIGFVATKTRQGSGYGYNYNYEYYNYGNEQKHLDAA